MSTSGNIAAFIIPQCSHIVAPALVTSVRAYLERMDIAIILDEVD